MILDEASWCMMLGRLPSACLMELMGCIGGVAWPRLAQIHHQHFIRDDVNVYISPLSTSLKLKWSGT